MRIAVIFHRFGPYHVARLDAAAQLCDITGIEVAGQTSEYGWSQIKETPAFQRVTVFPAGDTRKMPAAHISTRIRATLENAHADAVAIPGWSDNAAVAALRWCIENATPAILMSETAATDEPRIAWREQFKKRIVDHFSSGLVGGRRHADYLAELGMPPERIFTGYDVVDNDYFSSMTKRARQDSRLRATGDLPAKYFLASSRFIPKKNLIGLFDAYATYHKAAGPNASDLVLLGDGALREELEQKRASLGLANRIHVPGFKQYDELPVYYAFAEAFVHASTTEQWGLVVNEAVASGLPVIVSNRCGCAPELVSGNGFTFDPFNPGELAKRLLEFSSMSETERVGLRQRSREIADLFAPRRFAEGLKQAAALTIDSPHKRLGLIDRAVLFAAMYYRR